MKKFDTEWLSLSGAARYLDVSPDTISRRGIDWPKDGKPVLGKLRRAPLKLGDDTRQEKRYIVDDLESLIQK
jgi:hypothetical protein